MQENIIVFPKPPAGDKAQLVTSALPVSPTSLIGREHEMKAIHALLLRPDVRLLTLTGTAGVGKTRLALQVALDLVHDFAGGVHLVSLAPLSDPTRSEEHTSELQSRRDLVCRLLLEKKKRKRGRDTRPDNTDAIKELPQ